MNQLSQSSWKQKRTSDVYVFMGKYRIKIVTQLIKSQKNSKKFL